MVELAAKVYRGDVIEALHHAVIAVLDSKGRLTHYLGRHGFTFYDALGSQAVSGYAADYHRGSRPLRFLDQGNSRHLCLACRLRRT